MAFMSSVEGLATIETWSDAHAYYEMRDKQMRDNKRIRNRFDGVPLQRSKHDAWGRKLLIRHDDNSYSAVLHDTSVVRWYADGDISVDTSYDSRSTNLFAYYYVPSGCRVSDAHSLWVRGVAVSKDGQECRHAAVYHEGMITLRVEGDDRIVFLDNTIPHVRRLSKRGDISKRTKPVIDYISMLFELNNDTFDGMYPPYDEDALTAELWDQVKDGGEFDPEDAVRYACCFVTEKYGHYNGQYGYHKRFRKAEAARRLNDVGYEELGYYVYKPVAFGEHAPDDWVPESEVK